MASANVTYNDDLRYRLATNLRAHPTRFHHLGQRRHAAVAVIVIDSDETQHGHDPTTFDRASVIQLEKLSASQEASQQEASPLTGKVDGTAGGAAVMLTRRAARLSTHAHQWAFPGGRIDQGETTLEAALREVEEEVALTLSRHHYLGRLDDYPTRSGYVIAPLVFWAEAHAEPIPAPEEVASIHRISLRELSRPDAPRFVTIPESPRPVIQMPVGGDLIHAPTGAILHQFVEVAYRGNHTRVDHFEQPVFAWG